MGIILIFYQWCYLAAVDRIGVAAATLIALCVPSAQVALLSALFLGETLSRTALFALGGALLGTVMLVGSPTVVADGGVMLAGVPFALGSAASIAADALGNAVSPAGTTRCCRSQSPSTGTVVVALIALGYGFSLDQPMPGQGLVL